MFVIIPVITLLASALLPAVGALPTVHHAQALRREPACSPPSPPQDAPPAPPVANAAGAGPSTDQPVSLNAVSETVADLHSTPDDIGIAAGTGIKSTSDIKLGLGLKTDSGKGAGAGADGGVVAHGSGYNDDGSLDVWVWANNLDASVRAIIVKLDGKVDLSSSCQDIINEINASVTALASVKVYSQDHLSAIVKLIADLYIDIILAICKYTASSIAASVSVLSQLDGCLKGLVGALDVQYDGLVGLCASIISGAGLSLRTFTQVGFKLCASVFFGAN